MTTGAICNLLEPNPKNPKLWNKLKVGECPECGKKNLIAWCPQSGFHDLCTHYHCLDCDADYCHPIAWQPPMPIVKMKGTICPRERRHIAKIAKDKRIDTPDWWKPIMESDLKPVIMKVNLRCYECHNEKQTEVIVQAGYWHFGRGKYPRGWFIDEDGSEMSKPDGENVDRIYALCPECYKGKRVRN